MKLFEKFNNTYLMNLKKRPDRLEHFNKQVDKFNLGTYQYFEAVDGTLINNPFQHLKSGEYGHILTTIKILEDALIKQYDNILIVEDDCMFFDAIKNINEYFQLLPNDWEMLYFGGNHNLHVGAPPPIKINDRVVKLHSTYSSHCIAFKKEIIPIILSELKSFSSQTDVTYRKIQSKYNVYCFYPTLATQITGHSDIQNKVINYSWMIK